MLRTDNKRFYHAPRVGEAYPATVDEDSYHRELWEEIPTLFNNRMTDEEFEIFARLDGGVKFEEPAPSDDFYLVSGDGSTTCYFSDEDLFRRLDDYDYPREVDDDYDACIGDIYHDDIWIGHDGEHFAEDSDQDSQMGVLEDVLVHPRFFYANDLCDRGDLWNSVYSDQEERQRSIPPDVPELLEVDGVFDRDVPTFAQTGPPTLSTRFDKPTLQGEYEPWRSIPYVQPLAVSRARARSN